MNDKLSVLVFGATGQQGGAVVKALLKDGQDVIGLTRNPESEKAELLKQLGVDVRKGDSHKAEDLIPMMKKVDSVFALTTPFEEGVEKETEQGISIAEAAYKAGVRHFVFNSVSDADRKTGIPHFDSKYEVEKRIISLDIPYTIIAPVYFMTNLVSPWTMETIKNGKISMPMPGNRKLQQIDVPDIASVVATVIKRRESFFKRRINIASDELSGNKMAETLSKTVGKNFVYEGFAPSYMREQSADMADMYEWFDKVGYSVDIKGLKKEFPDISFSSFEDYVRRIDWSFMN